jgi:type IV secretory pathway component VirB8
MEAFTPSAELSEFAHWFSSEYKTLEPGTYYSNEKTYQIIYADRFNRRINIARLTANECQIEIETAIKNCSSDFVFFIILWYNAIHKFDYDAINCDTTLLRYCNQKGFSVSNISKDLILMISRISSTLNKNRVSNFKV